VIFFWEYASISVRKIYDKAIVKNEQFVEYIDDRLMTDIKQFCCCESAFVTQECNNFWSKYNRLAVNSE